jgi:hypothetical protein
MSVARVRRNGGEGRNRVSAELSTHVDRDQQSCEPSNGRNFFYVFRIHMKSAVSSRIGRGTAQPVSRIGKGLKDLDDLRFRPVHTGHILR